VVAAESLLVIAVDVVQAPNDKQQIAPMLEKVDALPKQLGRPETLLADNGYFSEANVMACMAANIEPLIATGRQPHHPSWRERFTAPPPAPENPTPVEAMAWRLRTPQGKQLYALRKQTPEPVFGRDSANSCYAGSIASAASGASSPWPGTSSGYMRSASAERFRYSFGSRLVSGTFRQRPSAIAAIIFSNLIA
jgi:hypothetical protein